MRTPRCDITLDRFMGVAHPLPRRRGNVTVGNHTFVNALPWIRRAGAPWRDPPERHGKWITVCRRFDRRSGNGAMGRLFTALREARIIGGGNPHARSWTARTGVPPGRRPSRSA